MRRVLRMRRVRRVYLPLALAMGLLAVLVYSNTLRAQDAAFDWQIAAAFFGTVAILVFLLLLIAAVRTEEVASERAAGASRARQVVADQAASQPAIQAAPQTARQGASADSQGGFLRRRWKAVVVSAAAVIGGLGGAYAYLDNNDTVEAWIIFSITLGALAGALIVLALFSDKG